ncbi:hypothetical protein [Symbioplanes lichenis]|uniref:hypothetical protein n=1 Tax=Symbioplanes lichenis TaxID=1629072 RepID=UPI0027384ACF|nr:hypothetical protein [Actinoplanes lichenis]
MAGSADPNIRFRAILAFFIIMIGIGGIVVVSVYAILSPPTADRTEMTRLVFTAVLPLLGTWVGTVLAFYFARESLQAATDSTNQLVSPRRDPLTPVTSLMIPRGKAVTHALSPGQRPETVLLSELMAEMSAAGRHRIPVVDALGVVVYVVHEATVTKFISIPPVPGAASAPPADPLAGRTIADLLGVAELAELIRALGYVPVSATIKEARGEMHRIPNCNDVFVTAVGRNDEPYEGWITNTDLASMT